MGPNSCKQVYHIGTVTDANCDGNQGCAHANIVGERVYCRGRLSCDRTTLTITDTVYGYGYKSITGASINAKVVDAYGYKSIEKADIDSGNINEEK